MLKLIANGLKRALLKRFGVCTPGIPPVIHGTCMIVHEISGALCAMWVVPQRLRSLSLRRTKAFLFTKNRKDDCDDPDPLQNLSYRR